MHIPFLKMLTEVLNLFLIFNLKMFLHLFIVDIGGISVSQSVQRTTYGGRISLSTTWPPGTEVRLGSKGLYPVSNLTSPVCSHC